MDLNLRSEMFLSMEEEMYSDPSFSSDVEVINSTEEEQYINECGACGKTFISSDIQELCEECSAGFDEEWEEDQLYRGIYREEE